MNEAIDLGHGHTLRFYAWGPDRSLNPQFKGIPDVERYGALVSHPARPDDTVAACAESGRCDGAITFAGDVQPAHRPERHDVDCRVVGTADSLPVAALPLRRPRLHPRRPVGGGPVKGDLARPAVFGSFDGTSSLLGVVIYLMAKDPRLIFPAALSGAVTSALSMGAGEWLSDSESGLPAASVMALATFCGALLPALPFGLGSGTAALAWCAVLVVAAGAGVSLMRANRGLGLSLAETFGTLAACTAAAALLGLVLPGGAG